MSSRVAGLRSYIGREAIFRETMDKMLSETEQSLDTASREKNDLYFENQQLRLHIDALSPAAAALDSVSTYELAMQ